MRYNVIFRQGKLSPATKHDNELINDDFVENTQYSIEIRKARNIERLQLYWVVCKRFAELESSETKQYTKERVHRIMKLTYFGNEEFEFDGKKFLLEPSISFEVIKNEKDFIPYFEWFCDVICRRYELDTIQEFLSHTESNL